VERFWLFLVAAALGAQGTEYPAVQLRSNYLFSYYVSHAMHATPWWPSWSPDGKWIAVSMYGSIWKVDPANGTAWELTHARKLHGSPCWSPDGEWIVYTADDHWKSVQLEALHIPTGRTVALTNDTQVYLDPVFSPDGTMLAYVTSVPHGNLNVHVRPIRRGEWAGEPVPVTRDHDFGRPRQYFSRWDFHTQPAWLADGKGLLLVANRGVALGSGDLWRVPLEPDAMPKGRPFLTEQTLYRTRPHVSPEGKRVVYSSTAGGASPHHSLYLLPVTGGQPFRITFGEYDDFHPRWSPDGERLAFISNRGGLPQLHVLDLTTGQRREVRIRERRWKQPRGRLRVRVIDEATGQTTDARISGAASDGKLYGPEDAFAFNARMPSGLERVFNTPGEFTVEVPPGEVALEAHKGFEYLPASKRVTVRAGQAAEVSLVLRRIVNLPARGWFNGTTHTHMNYGGPLRNTPAALLAMARAADLHVVASLVANKDNRMLDTQFFIEGGREHPASNLAARSLLLLGQEIRPSFWGHLFAVGLREHLVFPFVTGYEGTALDSLYPGNTDLLKAAQAQGALTGYVHAFGGDADPLESGLGGAKGFAVDVALGTADALEWSAASRGSLIPLFHAWNNEFRIAPVGGEDALNNMQDQRPIGIIRTYAQLGQDFSARAWMEAIRAGRVFFTSGPLVDFRVNGPGPGGRVDLDAAGGEVNVEAEIWSRTPVTKVTLYASGAAARDWRAPAPSRLRERVRVDRSGWLSLVVEAEDERRAPGAFGQAGTGAVWIYCGGRPIRSRASAEYFLRWIARLREQTADPALWRTERERAKVFAQFDEAVRVYEQRAREAQP
jgi:Tol biopolymer transport system component